MRLARNLSLSRRGLGAHKTRTFLALVGLSIGTAAVIVLRAAGDGARREAVAEIEKMGTNLLIVQAGRAQVVAGRARQGNLLSTLTVEDGQAVAAECRTVAAAAPAQDRTLEVKYGDTMTRTMVLGSTADYLRISNSQIASGRLFTDEEAESATRVAVVGDQAARNLFAGADPIGKIIRVGRIPFVVVGVLLEKGVGLGGSNEDDKVLIPLKTGMRRVFNTDYVKTVFVSVRRREEMGEAEREIAAILRERHRLDRHSRPDDFSIQSQATVLAAAESASASFTSMVVGVGAVSLGVGGIGILALMILAVRERTPEIGLRMAVGSRPRDILVQFLSEALMLGLAGGLVGVVLGATAAVTVGLLTKWRMVIAVGPVVLAVISSLGLGLLFGAYPARKAASLDPIVALRTE